jgi:hypothetical protein
VAAVHSATQPSEQVQLIQEENVDLLPAAPRDPVATDFLQAEAASRANENVGKIVLKADLEPR